MYAVIRAGGKQYRVSPGDVIRIESTPAEKGVIEFGDVLAVSGSEGQIGRPEAGARVVGTVMEEGRADKILVFHYKRKKQYKKLRGHRQAFTAVRISEISFDGQRFTAPDLPARTPKAKKAGALDAAAKLAGGAVGTVEGIVEGVTQPTKHAGKGKGGSRPTGKKSAGKKGGRGTSSPKKGGKK
jgi:large subunit ribosomal protein L21